METWDNEVTLIGASDGVEDDIGQRQPVDSETTVYCCQKPISRQEFYLAGQNDIRVSEILIVHPYEYGGENEVIFRGKRLSIVKTYPLSPEELELTCSEKIGGRDG